jgi:predicted DNA-binding protein
MRLFLFQGLDLEDTMPTRTRKVVGFQLSEEDEQRLERLCRGTERTRSGVIRLLLSQATMGEQPDIRLTIERDATRDLMPTAEGD